MNYPKSASPFYREAPSIDLIMIDITFQTIPDTRDRFSVAPVLSEKSADLCCQALADDLSFAVLDIGADIIGSCLIRGE